MQTMQLLRYIIVMNTILVIPVNGFLDYGVIQGYFDEKSLHYGSIIGCFSKRDQLKLARSFINQKYVVSILNINEVNVRKDLNITNHIAVVLDGDCDTAQSFLIRCGKYMYFDVKHHWLILSSTKNFSNIFDNVELYLNADIHVAYPDEKNGTLIIEDVYNPASKRGGLLHRSTLGFYNKNVGYSARQKESKYWVRRDLAGVTLKSIIVLPVEFEGDLMDYLNSDKNREINTFNRFHYSLMQYVRKYYNFTANVTLSKSWGYKKEDDTFDGLVGALERKTVDYGSSPLFVRADRAEVMEYGRRTWILRAAFLFRNPKSRNSVERFVKPLSLPIWMLTLCSLVLIVLCLKVSYWYETKSGYKKQEMSWSYFFICAFGAFCQQGMPSRPRMFSSRIVKVVMFMLCMLIYQFYSASLVSHLLMKSPTRIKTVEDILHSNLRAGCEDILYNRDYFQYTTDKPSKALYFKKVMGKNNRTNFLRPEDGLGLVRKGGYAFHVELATAYPIIRKTFKESAICELREVQMYITQPVHANVQKHSPFRDMFDTCLQRVAEHGILSREILFWHPMKPECIHAAKAVTFNIGLDDFYPALMVLGIGMLISLVILYIEIYLHHREASSKNKDDKSVIYPFVI